MDKNEMKYPVEKAKGKNNEKIHKIIIKAILRNIKKIYDLRDIYNIYFLLIHYYKIYIFMLLLGGQVVKDVKVQEH